MSNADQQTSPLGVILFAILAFHAAIVFGVFLSNGTSLMFDIIAAEAIMSGVTAVILSVIALICAFALVRDRNFNMVPLMGLGVVCALAANFALAAYLGSVEPVVSPLALTGGQAQQPIGMAMSTVRPLFPFVIAMALCIPAIRMINPGALQQPEKPATE